MPRCPGQDQRFWKPDDIFESQCTHCGAAIEFWKDEPSLKCPQCRKLAVNPKLDLGCAEWCQYAEQCLGTMADLDDILCRRLIREAKELCGRDDRRLDRSLRIFQNARQIQAREGGDIRLITAAAVLYEVGSAAEGQDLSALRDILFRCGLDSDVADRVCQVIAACRNEATEESPEAKILWDAVHLERLATGAGVSAGGQAVAASIDSVDGTFRTGKGRELARNRFVPGPDVRPPS